MEIDDQSRCPRDVLAHLYEWQRLFETWYAEGMAGGKAEVPAPGYSWRQTPALNAELWQRHRTTSYDDALHALRASHARVMAIIGTHSDEELFTKKYYPWTGSTSLGSYLVSCTSGHYEWGQRTLKRLRAADSDDVGLGGDVQLP